MRCSRTNPGRNRSPQNSQTSRVEAREGAAVMILDKVQYTAMARARGRDGASRSAGVEALGAVSRQLLPMLSITPPHDR